MVILWQQLKMAVSSPPQHVQGNLSPALPHQTRRLPKRLGWSRAHGAAGPGQQSGSVLSHRLPELTPAATAARVGELWTGSTATRSSRRPGTGMPVDRICLQQNYPSPAKAEAPEEHWEALQQPSNASLCISSQTPLC